MENGQMPTQNTQLQWLSVVGNAVTELRKKYIRKAQNISKKTFRDLVTQIGILVPIELQRRTNGTSGTGSSIKHLKAVPS